MHDLRFAIRQLLKNPGFTAMAVVTLAVGIGANTAIFGALNELLFKPLPVKDPDSLMAIVLMDGRQGGTVHGISYPIYRDFSESGSGLSDLISFAPLFVRIQTEDGRVSIQAQIVSESFFSALGLKPALGRTFSTADAKLGAEESVAILSHEYWAKRFNEDQSVIGQTLQLHDGIAGPKNFTIIGVAPAEFRGFGQWAPAVWIPVAAHTHFKRSQFLNFHLLGRLRPGASAEQATADLNLATARIASKYGGGTIPGYEDDGPFQAGLRATLKPAGRGLWGPFRDQREIWLATRFSFGTVLMVLLVACGNVANLLLARAAIRQRETAVRLSLGATRGRLVRQLLTESLVLAALACVAGLILARWSSALLAAIKPANVLLEATHLDLRVISFAVLISLLTTIVFGLVPALQATHCDLNAALKEDSRTSAGNDWRIRLRRALIVGQMAFSLVLLIGAGLCWRSFGRLQSVDPGFEYKHLLTATIDSEDAGLAAQSRPAFYRELVNRLETLPGVRSVSFADSAPFHSIGWMSGPLLTEIEGYVPRTGESGETKVHLVGPRYFETLGIPQTHGSDPSRGERGERILVNESFARRYWPGMDPVGRRLGRWRVDGVVRDGRLRELWQPAEPEIFWEREEPLGSQFNLLVRATDDPALLIAVVRNELAAFNRALKITRIEPVTESVRRSLGAQRFAAVLMGNVALAALFLAAVGIYGLMSFLVTQRTREIGIRMALGAQSRQVLALIVGQGLKLVLLGAALGTFVAMALSRTLTSRLYEMTPIDPVTFSVVPIVLGMVALAACWLPARRASKVDPTEALRHE